MKKVTYILIWVLLGGVSAMFTSCGDFLDQESDRVISADKDRLNAASDTLYSVIGIMNKLQALSDRTILLGELRGDLSEVQDNASADLRELANFNVSTENKYNAPRDYYAVINNCNYFLAKADTMVKNSKNERIFAKEYAAVKAFRAWTYLQLVLNYGKVPLITTPILTKDDADRQYEMKDIQGICNYFVSDIAPYANVETPNYGTIRGNDSKLFYFPIYVLMGDMNLWAGNYREAALCYYKYINSRNGSNSSYPIDKRTVSWSSSDSKWRMIEDGWSSDFQVESNSATSELITEIPGDSIPAEGNYSELKNLFSSSASNNYKVSIMPSVALRTLSQAQKYCHLNADKEVIYAPDNLKNNRKGDLRYLSSVSNYSGILGGDMVEEYVINNKYSSRNVHIYRRTMVYLRMAEALNRAGFPRFAFAILKTGVNNDVIENDVLPYYPEEKAFLQQFDFPTSKYKLRTKSEGSDENTVGIHSKGSGWSEYNDFYVYPERDNMAEEQDAVEDLIVDEGALEFAYEGIRFYDLMRVALRRNNPAYLADKVYARQGEDKKDVVKSLIKSDLNNISSWYLNWDGKVGLGPLFKDGE